MITIGVETIDRVQRIVFRKTVKAISNNELEPLIPPFVYDFMRIKVTQAVSNPVKAEALPFLYRINLEFTQFFYSYNTSLC